MPPSNNFSLAAIINLGYTNSTKRKGLHVWVSILLALFTFQSVIGQNVYDLSYPVDISFGAAGVSSLTIAYFLGRNDEGFPADQIPSLNRDDIWKLDRGATYNWSPGSALASDIFLYSSVAVPALLLINENVRKERYITLIYLETLTLNMGITSLTKELTERKRPFMYNPDAPLDKKLQKDALRSFFSGHTSMTAASSFFMASVFADLNPNSNLKPLVWTSAALLPAITGILRFTAGKHFPTDILVGYAVGAAIGILVPYAHKKIHKE